MLTTVKTRYELNTTVKRHLNVFNFDHWEI